jgi:hypothetical protein
MKKILLMAMAVLAFAGCVKDEPYKAPTGIANVSHTPATPTSEQAVTVTATVNGFDEALLVYTVNGGAEVEVEMAKSGTTFTGTIPALADGSVVVYWVEAGELGSDDKGYTVTDNVPTADYTKLKLNEVSGVGADADKYVELYNMGETALSLEGVKVWYGTRGAAGDFGLSWTGAAGDQVAAGGFFVIKGAKGSYPSLSTGLSGKKNVIVALFAPGALSDDETTETFTVDDALNLAVDFVQRGAGDDSNAADESPYGRILDGNGQWYLFDGTEGATNGTSTTGLKPLNEGHGPL